MLSAGDWGLTLVWWSNPWETPTGENRLGWILFSTLAPLPPLRKGVNLPWNTSQVSRAIKRSHYISINLPSGWLAAAILSRRGSCFLSDSGCKPGRKRLSPKTHCLIPRGAALAICSVFPSRLPACSTPYTGAEANGCPTEASPRKVRSQAF